MGSLLRATVRIEGIRPILWHAFTPDAIPLQRPEQSGVPGNDPEEWKRTVLMTADRQLFLFPTSIFGCLRAAARYTKKGKGSIQTELSATVQIEDELILIDRSVPTDPPENDRTAPVYIDIASVRNPTTKARNVRYRVAASTGWQAGFSVVWDRTIISRAQMEAVVLDAGRYVGLGDGRSIGNGRFMVRSFEVQEI